ncbi:uncharacterized protein [Periplaneta americana]|uniref:uncharacterized protein n=1 Tax=Periplaneta americana TaxID=6978 RepID=UPI0037E89F50
MKTFLILSLALWTALLNNCSARSINNNILNSLAEEYQPLEDTYSSYKSFVGLISPHGGPKKGQARVNLDGAVITNITITQHWRNGNGTIDITAGGIGHDYVGYYFDISEDGYVYFETKIYSTDDVQQPNFQNTQQHDKMKHFLTKFNKEQFAVGDIIMEFAALGLYSPKNNSRSELYIFTFDKVVSSCFGESFWHSGEGNTEVSGGISESYLGFTTYIPSQVSGTYVYDCDYVEEESQILPKKRSLTPQTHADVGNSGFDFAQVYSSITSMYAALVSEFENYTIVDFNYNLDMKNGTGTMTADQGGVGYSFIEFLFNMDSTAYGSFTYNVVLKPNETSAVGNRDWIKN